MPPPGAQSPLPPSLPSARQSVSRPDVCPDRSGSGAEGRYKPLAVHVVDGSARLPQLQPLMPNDRAGGSMHCSAMVQCAMPSDPVQESAAPFTPAGAPVPHRLAVRLPMCWD